MKDERQMLCGAKLRGAMLRGAMLRGAMLRGAILLEMGDLIQARFVIYYTSDDDCFRDDGVFVAAFYAFSFLF